MYKTILLAVDLGEDASWKKALPAAIALARNFGATLHMMTVVPDLRMGAVTQFFPEDFEETAVADVDKQIQAFAAEHVPEDVAVAHHVALGSIYEEILATAKRVGADLIVMAAHRPELKDYLLGPNAARVVRHADCSVLVVRD